MGQAVVDALPNTSGSVIAWRVLPPTTFPGGVSEIINKVKDDQTWIAVTSMCQAISVFSFLIFVGSQRRREQPPRGFDCNSRPFL